MSLRSPIISLIFLAGLGDAAPAAPKAFPWKLDRAYTYAWLMDGRKIGEIRFRLSEIKGPGGRLYKLSSHRRLEHGGIGHQATGELYFNPDGTPVRFQGETRFGTVLKRSGSQELRVQFSGNRVTSTHIHNGKEEKAARREAEVPRGTYLFATWCMEHWTVFAARVGQEKEVQRAIQVFYPEFGKAIELIFTPEKAEKLEVDGRKLPVTRYRFENKSYSYDGSIWIDEQGRMVQYRSGPSRLILHSK